MRSILAFFFISIPITLSPAAAAPHPLAPLTADEIRAAANLLRSSNRFPAGGIFSLIALDEPPKELVLAKGAIPRRAFAVIYDRKANQTFEAIANLSTSAIDSWKLIPGAQPAINSEDSDLADEIVRADPRWARAMNERGIRGAQNVLTMAWSAGYFGQLGTDAGRIVCVVPYYGGAGANLYAHPVEGVVAHVNLTTGKIIDFLDMDRNVPVSRENADLGARASPLRPGVDCPANCTVFDAVVAESSGEPHTIPGAVALYERDAGVAWKHENNTRRERELVLSYFSQPGNYEYGFDWVFHQNGTIEVRVLLTGIMAAKGVAGGSDPHSHLVAKNLAAPHHQHFFTFRLDMDVDGTPNRVVEKIGR